MPSTPTASSGVRSGHEPVAGHAPPRPPPRSGSTGRRSLILASLALLASGPLAGQTGEGVPEPRDEHDRSRYPVAVETAPRPAASAARAMGSIVLDGVLDEEGWSAAEPISDFIQSTPRTGYPATERTEVRILYDEANLYVGAELYDSNPEGIVHQYMDQDFETHDEDVFAISLDTFLDRRNAFLFLINPNGAVKDIQAFDNSRNMNIAWEGVVEVETRIHDGGWTVEMAIPLTTLRFEADAPVQSWGLQLMRRIRRKAEDSYWAPVDIRTRVHKMARAGTLTGLQDLRAGRNLSVKPYALAARSAGSALGSRDRGGEMDGGLDLKYGVTPRLTLDLTLRTDFSQVEVDREQVNLTRFGLFFPEKRDFFMENAGIFTFGDLTERSYRLGATTRDFTLFHSRRIGLDDGRPVPILGGGRLTGRVGEFEVGLLNMQTEETSALSPENFTVARLRRGLFGTADVGGIFVNRQATDGSGGYNRSYGVDANVRLWRDLIVHSYLAATDYPGADGNNRAARLSAAYRNRFWDVSALWRRIGQAFEPGVGFARRTGMTHRYATVGVHPRPGWPGVNAVNPYVELHYITDPDGALETREGIAALAVDFLDGGRFTGEISDRYEQLDDPFRVSGSDSVAPGRYRFREGSVMYQSSAGRPLSGSLLLGGGGFFDGERRTVAVGAAWRPSAHVSGELSVEHNDVRLPEGSFTADVFGARLNYAWSTRLLASAFVQYNSAADEVITNLRLNFIHSPLSDIFLVYTERRDAGGSGVLDNRLTLKVTKLFSF